MQTVEDQLRALMVAGLTGDSASYRALLKAIEVRLRIFYARRIGVNHIALEDLVQETLIAAHTRRATYDQTRPFTAWLHAIARYKLVDYLRGRRANIVVALDDVSDLAAPDEAHAATARLDVGRLLETVPKQARELIRAVKLEGHSVTDVAAASGLSESAVKVAIHRGLRRIALQLKGLKRP